MRLLYTPRSFAASTPRRALLPYYYRLLGARIAKGVILSPLTNIKEFDLVTIGDECVLDACTLSPFELSAGAFTLRHIQLGARVIMGPKSIAAPGARVPDEAYIPPKSSSYELATMNNRADREEALLNAKGLSPAPHLLVKALVCFPIIWVIRFIASIPALAAIYGMIAVVVDDKTTFQSAQTLAQAFLWFATPQRLPWYAVTKFARDIVYPVLHVTLAILLKRLVLGSFKAGPRTNSQWELTRYFLVEKLITKSRAFEEVGLACSSSRVQASESLRGACFLSVCLEC